MSEEVQASRDRRPILDALFSIDVRALGAFRIALGAFLLFNVVRDVPNIRAFYSDQGFLPRTFLFQHAISWRLSLHLFNGTVAYEAGLFLLQAVAATAMLVGVRTRLATLIAFVLVASAQARNVFVLDVGDQLLRLLLLWSVFLPLGLAYSVDGASAPRSSLRIRSLATGCLLAQVAFMFLFAGVYKLRSPMWLHGSGLYYALGQDEMRSRLGDWLLHQPALLIAMNYSVLAIETGGALLLFAPVWNRQLRTLGLLGLVGLFAGFAVFLDITPIPVLGVVALVPFTGAKTWDWIEARAERASTSGLRSVVRALSDSFRSRAPERWRMGRAAKTACVGLLLYAVTCNVAGASRWFSMPVSLEWLGYLTTIDQDWGMFFRPNQNSTWWVADATLDGGTHVDLNTGGALNFDEPPNLQAALGGLRWASYVPDLVETVDGTSHPLVPPLIEFLCSRWNERHRDAEHAASVEIIAMRRPTASWTSLVRGEDGARPGVDRQSLGQARCLEAAP